MDKILNINTGHRLGERNEDNSPRPSEEMALTEEMSSAEITPPREITLAQRLNMKREYKQSSI